jgi:hypothetical protein
MMMEIQRMCLQMNKRESDELIPKIERRISDIFIQHFTNLDL